MPANHNLELQYIWWYGMLANRMLSPRYWPNTNRSKYIKRSGCSLQCLLLYGHFVWKVKSFKGFVAFWVPRGEVLKRLMCDILSDKYELCAGQGTRERCFGSHPWLLFSY